MKIPFFLQCPPIPVNEGDRMTSWFVPELAINKSLLFVDILSTSIHFFEAAEISVIHLIRPIY